MAKRGLTSVQRTLRACRDQGRYVEKVEQWISFVGRKEPKTKEKPFAGGTRRDAFGFIDILAIDPHGIVAIQACTQTGKEHLDKILNNEYAHAWTRAGGKIELWVWRKVKIRRGMKQERWEPKVIYVNDEDFSKLPERPF